MNDDRKYKLHIYTQHALETVTVELSNAQTFYIIRTCDTDDCQVVLTVQEWRMTSYNSCHTDDATRQRPYKIM